MGARNKYQRAAGEGVVPQPLNRDRIAAILDSWGAHYGRAENGDLGGTWDGHLVEFLSRGEQGDILMVRARWQVLVPTDHLVRGLELCNAWNGEHAWPKTYVDPYPEGFIFMCDVTVDHGPGVTDAQLEQHMRIGLSTGVDFLEHLKEQLPEHTEWRSTAPEAPHAPEAPEAPEGS